MTTYTTQDNLYDDDYKQYDESEQDNQDETIQPAAQNSGQVNTIQPAITQNNSSRLTTRQSTVPQGINEKIPVSTPQITKTSTGQDLNEIPQLSKADMDKVRQGVSVWDIIDKLYKPKSVDEKTLDKNRMLGAIGDSIMLLGKMFAVSKGAHIRPDDPKNSLTNYFLKNEKELRDAYEKHLDAYNKIRFSTAMDELKRRQQEQAAQAKQKADQDWKTKEAKDKRDFDTAQNAANRQSRETIAANEETGRNNRADKSLAEQTQYHKTRNAIAWTEANKKNSGGGSGNTKGGTGNNKENYYKIVGDALKNQLFLDSLPDSYFDVKIETINGKRQKVRTPKVDNHILAEQYKDYLQNNQQSDENNYPATATTQVTPAVTQSQADSIKKIVGKYSNDDDSAIREIGTYLKNEGYSKEEVGAIIKSLQ